MTRQSLGQFQLKMGLNKKLHSLCIFEVALTDRMLFPHLLVSVFNFKNKSAFIAFPLNTEFLELAAPRL